MPARKRKPVTPDTETTAPAGGEPPAASAAEPDVFDHVIAAQAAAPAPAATGTESAPAEGQPGEAAAGAYQPDPHPFLTVPLGEGADAPRVRLFRNRRMNQVAVQFDQKPAEAVRQRMRDEGYRWREAEGVWTKQLGDQRATGQVTAERLVNEIANGIRAEAGLPPVGRAVGE